MGEMTAHARERIGLLLEGEESEGALMRIADTLEEVLVTLETALDVENEHSPAYELWRIRKAVEPSRGRATAARRTGRPPFSLVMTVRI